MAKIYHMLIYFHFSKRLNLELKVSKGIGPKQVLPEALIPDLHDVIDEMFSFTSIKTKSINIKFPIKTLG